jgi:hypothetical protein
MRKKIWRVPIVAVCQLLLLQSAWGGQPIGQANLRIVVVEGEGARNVVQQIPPRPLLVRVEDANNRPVAGATVLFRAPGVGPSGEFADDNRTISVRTGPDGLASAGPFHPNSITGMYQIRVTAEFQGATAMALLSQTNIPEKKGHGKLIAILAIAGAAGVTIALRSRDNTPSSSNTPTITFGGSAVGAPK